MKLKTIALATIVICPFAGQAATINSVTDAAYKHPDIEVADRKNETLETASGETSLSLRSEVVFDDGSAIATSLYDHADMSFNLWANASSAAGGEPTQRWARSRFSTLASYTASGNGTLFLDMIANAGFSTLTDRDGPDPLTMVLAGFSVLTPDATVYERASSADPSSVFSEADGATVSAQLSSEIEVKNGDTIVIEYFGLADAGDFPKDGLNRNFDSSFFAANAHVRGQFTLRTQGTTLIEDEVDLAPVPLPAALPLMLFGLGSLVAVTRRRQPR